MYHLLVPVRHIVSFAEEIIPEMEPLLDDQKTPVWLLILAGIGGVILGLSISMVVVPVMTKKALN